MNRNISPALELIKEFEGLKLKPYICPAGVATIGIGTTSYPDGKKVTLWDKPITEAQAYEYLKSYVSKDYEAIEKFLKNNGLELNDNQFSSLLVFSYNAGVDPIVNKNKAVAKALLAGCPGKVGGAFRLYNKASVGGRRVVLNGLKRRREAELALYLS